MDKKTIEIPFGAKDSELYKFEYTIPEGYEAEIKEGKVIVKKKESDDERIRKSLVEYFRKFSPKNMWDEVFSFGDVLSYLERQKELTRESVVEQLEKEFYACETTPRWFHNAIQGAINHGKAEALGELKAHEPVSTMKQKEPLPIPDKFSGLKSLMLQYLQSAANRKDDSEIEADTDYWAKKLLGLMEVEQQPAEWSEEDEGMYELFSYVIELVEDCPDKEKVKNWIKEIKGRFINSDYRSVGLHYILKNNPKSWKPSEEQMKALENVIKCELSAGLHTRAEILQTLQNDLKKLM